jgi:hypothetical protein
MRRRYTADALRYSRSMIRPGNAARSAPHEVREFRQPRLDMVRLNLQQDFDKT